MWNKVKDSKIFWAFAVGLVLFAGGYLLGAHKHVPVKIEEHIVENIETKQKLIEEQKVTAFLQEKLIKAQIQITDLKSHVKTVVHVVKAPDGTTTIDKTTESDSSTKVVDKTDTTKDTTDTIVAEKDKTVETDTKTHIDTTKITTPMPKDRYYLGLSARLSLTGVNDPGFEFKYRVFDLGKISIWSGAEVIAPLPNFKLDNIQFRLGLGASF